MNCIPESVLSEGLNYEAFLEKGSKRGQFLILIYKAAKATPLAWPAS